MIIRLVIAVIIVVVLIKLYQRVFLQKKCVACGQRIPKVTLVCHHCHTLQS